MTTISDERLAELLSDPAFLGGRDTIYALRELQQRRAAERAPRTPLREAAQAVCKTYSNYTIAHAYDEYPGGPPLHELKTHFQNALGLLREALAAPTPTREEVEAMIVEYGHAAAASHDLRHADPLWGRDHPDLPKLLAAAEKREAMLAAILDSMFGSRP